MMTAVRNDPFSKAEFDGSSSASTFACTNSSRNNIVAYGLNEMALQLAGSSIADVLKCLGGRDGVLNVADDAVAFVDGRMVDASYVLQPGERLELFLDHGQKSVWEEADRVLLERLAAAVDTLTETIRGSHKNQAKDLRLSPLEELIVQNLGDKTLRAKEIATLCRVDNSSHFRGTLAQLVKRGVLLRSADGYYVNRQDVVA